MPPVATGWESLARASETAWQAASMAFCRSGVMVGGGGSGGGSGSLFFFFLGFGFGFLPYSMTCWPSLSLEIA